MMMMMMTMMCNGLMSTEKLTISQLTCSTHGIGIILVL